MSGVQLSLLLGALVALAGALLALTRLPARTKQRSQLDAAQPRPTTADLNRVNQLARDT